MKHLLIISIILGITACTSHNSKHEITEQERALFESLETRCQNLVLQKQTDSLQTAAEYFIKQTHQGSKEYFDARRFYAVSFLNRGDFARTLQLIDEYEAMPGFKGLPGVRADYAFIRNRCYQSMGRLDEAIAGYRGLMDLTAMPGDTAAYEIIRLRTLDAINNINFIFFHKGAIADGAEWFHRLRVSAPKVARESCMREMMLFEGYMLGMCGQYAEGAAIVDSSRLLAYYRPDAETRYRDCSFAAAVYFTLPDRQKDVEALIKQTIEQGRDDNFMRGVTWGITALGQLYQQQARYKEAVELQHQGLEIGMQKNDSALCAQCFSCLSELYHKWKMYPQTRYYIDQAIKWGMNSKTETYDRGGYFSQKFRSEQLDGRNDFRMLTKADSCFALVNAKMARANLVGFKVEYWFNHCPDSIERGLRMLDDIPAQAGQGWSRLQYGAEALRTIGLIRLGREADARRTLLGIKGYNPNNEYVYLDTLMNHYLQQNDVEAIAHLTRLREPLSVAYQREQTIGAVMAADTRFQTEQKEQQNRLLSAEISLKDARLHTYIISGVFLIIVAGGVGGWLWLRQRSLRLRLIVSERENELAENHIREQSERLQQIIVSRQELNNYNEELLQQLAEIQTGHDETCNLDAVMERLQPRLLTNKEEEEFREAFAALYPTVLHRLRTICPRATRADELLAMLIVLKQTNEEIARTLGISRPSVRQNRYRLRSKLDLPEECELDFEVRRMLFVEN